MGSIEHNHSKIINDNQTTKLLNNLVDMVIKLDKKIDGISQNNSSRIIYQELKKSANNEVESDIKYVPQFIPSISDDKKINVTKPKKRKKNIDLNKSLDVLKKLGE